MVTPQLLATHGAGVALPPCQEQHVQPPALQDKRLGREMSAWGREEGAVPAERPAPVLCPLPKVPVPKAVTSPWSPMAETRGAQQDPNFSQGLSRTSPGCKQPACVPL